MPPLVPILSQVSPDFESVEVKVSPAQERGAADQESVQPDEEQGVEGGPVAGQGELLVVGDHHVPLHGQYGQGDYRLDSLGKYCSRFTQLLLAFLDYIL